MKITTAPSLILQRIVRNDAFIVWNSAVDKMFFFTGFYTNHLRSFSTVLGSPFEIFFNFFDNQKNVLCRLYYTWYPPPSAIVIITVPTPSRVSFRDCFYSPCVVSRITDGLIINLMDRWNIIRIPIIVKDERKAIFDCLAYNTQERNEYDRLPRRPPRKIIYIALRDLCDVSTTALSRMRWAIFEDCNPSLMKPISFKIWPYTQ